MTDSVVDQTTQADMQQADTAQTARWEPRESDLADWARVLLERSYSERPRGKCSRDDFAAGFVGALVAMRWRSAFQKSLDSKTWPAHAYPVPHIVDLFIDAGPDGTPMLRPAPFVSPTPNEDVGETGVEIPIVDVLEAKNGGAQ